jgi:hypothetical protein
VTQPAGDQHEVEAVISGVSDVPAALTSFADPAGFDLGWRWGNPLNSRHCLPRAHKAQSHTRSFGAGRTNAQVARGGVEAYFLCGVTSLVLGELADWPYGMRNPSVVDPCSNRPVFGGSMGE